MIQSCEFYRYYVPDNIQQDPYALSLYQQAMKESEENYKKIYEYLFEKLRNRSKSIALAGTIAQACAEQILPVAIREVDRRDDI